MRFVTVLCLVLGAFAISGAQAEPTDDSLEVYVVRILRGAEQNLGGAGVYLGRGLVITAAHVAGPNTSGVRIDGLDVAAKLIKTGTFPLLDLSLVGMDEEKLSVSLRLRRMPLCRQPPQVGAPVIVAAPQGITRSRILSPLLLSADLRWKIPGVPVIVTARQGLTDSHIISPLLDRGNLRWKVAPVISDGSTSGKSGSGVFDADKKCLLGILSQKISNTAERRDIATYFVPASTIQSFVPTGTRW